MATNAIFGAGDSLSWPVPDGTASGAPVRIGPAATGLNGVTLTKEGEGGNADNYATVKHSGVFALPVTTTTALAIGDPVYITSGNVLTPVASGNQVFGHAVQAKGTAAATIRVRIAN